MSVIRALSLLVGLAVGFSVSAADRARILFVTGVDYPGHLWKQTSVAMRDALGKDAGLEVFTVEDPAFLDSPAIHTYDAVFLHFQNWETPGPGVAARTNLLRFVESGKGLVLSHFACGAWTGEWPEFEKIAGRVWFGSNPPLGKRQHDPHGKFKVELARSEHPIVAGLADFETTDELYTCLTGSHPIEVVAQAKSTLDGQYYPIAFVSHFGNGRTFHCLLGHDANSLRGPTVAELFRRGVSWAAGLEPVRGSARQDSGKVPFASDDWTYLDNGSIRLGLNKSAGGCIGYLSLSGTNFNLLNSFDRGRFVQQSYYGNPDGTRWAGQEWRWNPVQGGDFKGTPAKLLSNSFTTTSAYTKTQARHWSGCVDLPDVIMEQWIGITGKVAHIRFQMTYHGKETHSEQDHEIPAVFVDRRLDTLVVYDGEKPWTRDTLSKSRPGWPNETRRPTENWAAYVDQAGFGVGAFVPLAANLTCYRYRGGAETSDACSYFAPLIRFAVTPGKAFTYDVYLAVGQVDELRSTYESIRKTR